MSEPADTLQDAVDWTPGLGRRAAFLGWSLLVLVPVTLVPAVAGTLGPAYAVSALALGGCFAALAWRLVRQTTTRRAGVLFHYSLAYLALLYCAMAADVLL